ncbi:MAG: hypothetical protein A2V77_11365 [Anaeromyxobacter sp. RBG_16_69_14]|nr:MAG: hypothetical protein A2V77_11365 [Anaeromyxobacter sp. RBG_16_69_14]
MITLGLLVPGCGGRDGSQSASNTAGNSTNPQIPAPDPARPPSKNPTSTVLRWNEIALIAQGVDHAPVAAGENRVFGEQLGPARSSRALAIVQIAVFDAKNAVAGGYRSYTGIPSAPGASINAAIAQAARDTLAALYPSQGPSFDAGLSEDLDLVPDGAQKTAGIDVGRTAAAAILSLREGDGSEYVEPIWGVNWSPSDLPGHWQKDPVSQNPIVMGAYWRKVKPFALASGDQYRIPPPPAMDSAEYAAAFDEVKRLGGDGITTPTERTDDQTLAGIYWAYDGTPGLGARPRQYNQMVVNIASAMGTSGTALARLLALANVAMADAAIAAWDSKYHYDFWRPVTAIRRALEDGNPATAKDPTFMPLGAPASNSSGPNFTPPFPSYPSGHATLGSASFEILRDFYGTDAIAFTFVSDELNGKALDNEGHVRPLAPRSFSSLTEAEEENGQSRIYLGIHWAFDKTEGMAQGRLVGDHVFRGVFQPLDTGAQ